jgi:hypothetical protein
MKNTSKTTMEKFNTRLNDMVLICSKNVFILSAFNEPITIIRKEILNPAADRS